MGTSDCFKMSKDWQRGLCDCCAEPEICCCGLFCYPCQTYKTANSLNRSGALFGLLACFFPCLPAFLLRQETRHRYDIDGNDIGDCGTAFCFPACVSCQTATEVKQQMNY